MSYEELKTWRDVLQWHFEIQQAAECVEETDFDLLEHDLEKVFSVIKDTLETKAKESEKFITDGLEGTADDGADYDEVMKWDSPDINASFEAGHIAGLKTAMDLLSPTK